MAGIHGSRRVIAMMAMAVASPLAIANAQPLDAPSLGRIALARHEAVTSSTAGPSAEPSAKVPPVAGVGRATPLGNVSPWFAPVLSAIVPGSGQALLREQRGVVYAAAEAYLILQAVRSSRDASRERDAYREIARTVARANTGGERPDGDWPYYERMQYALESGAFNMTPGGALTPETDVSTFNGSIWRLARETYWRDPDVAPPTSSPEYQRAIEFYQRRAAGEQFLWSWRDAQLQQDLYRQTIDRANDASRRTRQVVGILLANHALSLVDAYVSVRVRIFGTPDAPGGVQRLGIRGELPLPQGGR